MPTPQTLGEFLRTEIEKHNLNQSLLASSCLCAQPVINRYVNDVGTLTPRMAVKLAKGLGAHELDGIREMAGRLMAVQSKRKIWELTEPGRSAP